MAEEPSDSEDDSVQIVAEVDSHEEGVAEPPEVVVFPSTSSSTGPESEKSRNHDKKKLNYDQQLPANHLYLGRDLEDVGGGLILLDSNSISSNLPLFPIPNVILMPGQDLPLQSLHPRAISMFRNIVAQTKIFGVISMRSRPTGQELANIGTLAQVISYKDTTDEMTSMKLKAVGRQRFKLLDTTRQLDGVLVGKVRILPELMLGSLLRDAELSSMNQFKLVPSSAKLSISDSGAIHIPSKAKLKRNDKFFAAICTPIPSFLIQQYDLEFITARIKVELRKWTDVDRLELLSQRPVDFSYWVAQNLPVDDDLKLQILGINCCIQRLRVELSVMQKLTRLCCKECGKEIGSTTNVINMSIEGPMGTYVNPHGYVSETLCLSVANGLKTVGSSSTECSWFPGYSWTILNCDQCDSHMGWQFNAVKRKLKPTRFWGIARRSIQPTLPITSESEDERNSAFLPYM